MIRKTLIVLGIPILLLGVAAILVFGVWGPGHVEAMSGNPDQALACTNCHLKGTSARHFAQGVTYPSPTTIAFNSDESLMYVTCEDTDEIAIVSTATNTVTDHFLTGDRPHGLAVSPDDSKLYVALRNEHRIVALDPRTGAETATVPVGRYPCGVGVTPDGMTIVVANSISNDASIICTKEMMEKSRVMAGREPYAVAISEDGSRAYVANRMAAVAEFRAVSNAELTEIDLSTGRVAKRHELQSSHLSEGVDVNGGTAMVSLCRVRNLVPITQVQQGWVMSTAVGMLSPLDGTLRMFALDDVSQYYADPSGVAVDEKGGRAYIASGGANIIAALDLNHMKELAAQCEGDGPGQWADHLGASFEYVIKRIPTSTNPKFIRLSGDGSRLYVAEHLNDSIAVIDTEALEVVSRIDLGGPDESTDVRRGEMVFHRAAATFQGQFACRSCHADGHVDGLGYDFLIDGMGRNILDNRSLLGVKGTEPLKWTGKNKDLHRQCGIRFAMVLTGADPFPDQDLDDLVAYISSLPPPEPPQGHEGELTDKQKRGKEHFERTHRNNGEEIPVADRCPTCHTPPLFTNQLKSTVDSRISIDDTNDFDTPHLLGIGESAPYLHDGRSGSLEEIWTTHSEHDTHGAVNDMTKIQLNELVEYLKSL